MFQVSPWSVLLKIAANVPARGVERGRLGRVEEQLVEAVLAEADADLAPGLAAVGAPAHVLGVAPAAGEDDLRVPRMDREDIGVLVRDAEVTPGLAAVVGAVVEVRRRHVDRLRLRRSEGDRRPGRLDAPAGIGVGDRFPGRAAVRRAPERRAAAARLDARPDRRRIGRVDSQPADVPARHLVAGQAPGRAAVVAAPDAPAAGRGVDRLRLRERDRDVLDVGGGRPLRAPPCGGGRPGSRETGSRAVRGCARSTVASVELLRSGTERFMFWSVIVTRGSEPSQ